MSPVIDASPPEIEAFFAAPRRYPLQSRRSPERRGVTGRAEAIDTKIEAIAPSIEAIFRASRRYAKSRSVLSINRGDRCSGEAIEQ
jgi:hypothetical protein